MRRLDELKDKLDLKSDVELSFELRIGAGMLSHIRSGRRPVPVGIGADILHRLGYVVDRDLLIKLLSSDARATIRRIDREVENRSHLLGMVSSGNEGRDFPQED